MKKLLSIALILISISVNAQYSKEYKLHKYSSNELANPKIYIPSTVLIGAFITNANVPMTIQQRTGFTLSSFFISGILYLYLEKNVKKSKGRFIVKL